MTRILNVSRLGVVLLLPGILALTPTFAIAEAPTSAPPATAAQDAPPAGGMSDQHMMMDNDKMKPGMGMMDCNGKPCGPPQGAARHMEGMPHGMTSPGSSDPAAKPDAPAPMKDHM